MSILDSAVTAAMVKRSISSAGKTCTVCGAWKFNDSLVALEGMTSPYIYSIPAVNEGEVYTGIRFVFDQLPAQLCFMGDYSSTTDRWNSADGWLASVNADYRYIYFGETPIQVDETFYRWLTANAQQVAWFTVENSIDYNDGYIFGVVPGMTWEEYLADRKCTGSVINGNTGEGVVCYYSMYMRHGSYTGDNVQLSEQVQATTYYADY